jgi:hypothetical protein
LAKHRNPSRPRRTCPFHPNRRAKLRDQKSRDRRYIPCRSTNRSVPPRTRQGYREMAQQLRGEAAPAGYTQRRGRISTRSAT